MQPGCAYPAGLSTVAPDYRSGVSTSFTIAPFEEPSPEGLLGQPGLGSEGSEIGSPIKPSEGYTAFATHNRQNAVIHRLAPCAL
jgi:hypothetical protein